MDDIDLLEEDNYDELSEEKAEKRDIKSYLEPMFYEEWDDLYYLTHELSQWTNGVENQITNLQKTLSGIRDSFDKDHHKFISKLNDFNQVIMDLRYDFKVVDTTLMKMMPTLSENIKQLNTITKTIPASLAQEKETEKEPEDATEDFIIKTSTDDDYLQKKTTKIENKKKNPTSEGPVNKKKTPSKQPEKKLIDKVAIKIEKEAEPSIDDMLKHL